MVLHATAVRSVRRRLGKAGTRRHAGYKQVHWLGFPLVVVLYQMKQGGGAPKQLTLSGEQLSDIEAKDGAGEDRTVRCNKN